MKKKWQKQLMVIVVALGFGEKMKTGSLTADEQKKMFAEYEVKYGVSFQADREADEDLPEEEPVLSAETQQQLASIFGEEAPKTIKEAVPALASKVEEQQEKIDAMSNQPDNQKPIEKVAVQSPSSIKSIILGHAAHSKTHIFGIENELFKTANWYNRMMVNGKQAHQADYDITPGDKEIFKQAMESISSQLIERTKELTETNRIKQLDFQKMVAGESKIDYTDLMGTAGEYIVRRTDLILAYMRSLPSVDSIFPMVSNVQNKEIVPGAHFGELSQGYRKGKIFKGKANFTAELYQVNALMFKFLFEDLIDLEKQYIGYLNREGSDVIKWTFIEWIMVHFGEILQSERNQRRVIGVRVPQQNVISNPAMFGGDGALRAIERVVEEFKILPFLKMNAYDLSTILDYYEEMYDMTEQILPSMAGIQFYGNAKHKRAYTRLFRAKYGKDNDFTGVKEGLIDISPESIIWIPNMRNNDFIVFLTFPGNIENYEDRPNEMLGFYFEREWESVGVMSRWKEGSGLRQAGIKYPTLEALTASKFKNQFIFVNHPVTILDADATTVDADENTLFQTQANTAVTKITDIQNAEFDRVYKIICGSKTNASIIEKSGVFSGITSDWKPTAVGDYIKLYAEFKDVEKQMRKVRHIQLPYQLVNS